MNTQPSQSNNTNTRKHSHQRITGFSGNEIFCLGKMGLDPGNLCVGNSVISLGVKGGLSAGINILSGGEITDITSLIYEGRKNSVLRMINEAKEYIGCGVTGVSTEIVNHGTNIEFLCIGSVVHRQGVPDEHVSFSTSANAQELYCQYDAGFEPLQFVFGNVAYSIGVGGNLGGFFRSLKRGEVPQFSKVFDDTRHIALERITEEAKRCGANAVVGINTTITPFMGAQEMLMIGTASKHPSLAAYAAEPVTSDMTNEEMWNMVNVGYLPLRLVMGVSVYSLGFAGGIKSAFQSLGRGEIKTLTSLLYEAREKALDRIQKDAERWGADQVVGVKTHVYDLGGGLVEFLAIGTAVKKFEGVTTKTPTILTQAILADKDTFFETKGGGLNLSDRKTASAAAAQKGPLAIIFGFLVVAFYVIAFLLKHK